MVTTFLLFLAEWIISHALGSGVVKANDLRRLHKIKRHAPSAKVVSFHVALTQEDYDRLPETDDGMMYLIVPSAPQSTPDAPK